jgi:hypothetical protein
VPRPSEKRRIIYKGSATPVGGDEAYYIDLDSELWVIGVTETINLEGSSATVELADYDVVPESAAGRVVSQIKQLKAGARLPDADTFYEATVQTTDATPTIIGLFTVPTNSTVMIFGHVIGARSDNSAALLCRFGGTFRRAGGSITLAGGYADTYEDSASAPAVGLGTASTDIGHVNVTSVAAQTWNWKAHYRLVHLLD